MACFVAHLQYSLSEAHESESEARISGPKITQSFIFVRSVLKPKTVLTDRLVNLIKLNKKATSLFRWPVLILDSK